MGVVFSAFCPDRKMVCELGKFYGSYVCEDLLNEGRGSLWEALCASDGKESLDCYRSAVLAGFMSMTKGSPVIFIDDTFNADAEIDLWHRARKEGWKVFTFDVTEQVPGGVSAADIEDASGCGGMK